MFFFGDFLFWALQKHLLGKMFSFFSGVLEQIQGGILELGAWTESDDKEPGNFGDPVGLNQYTQEMRET